MIDVQASLAAIEKAARDHKVAIRAICRAAGITPSNWARWRHGTSPTIKKWLAVQQAVRDLIPLFSESETASPDSREGREALSSGHPIPDNGLSPPLDGLLAQSVESASLGASPTLSSSPSVPERRKHAREKS
jgi:hypothetical protein